MINHVVLFKLKEFPSEEAKNEVLNQFKSKLLALKECIAELKFIEVGLHYALQSPSYDLCLITHFETLADLELYKFHPEHLKVVEFVKEVTVERAAVDFEF